MHGTYPLVWGRHGSVGIYAGYRFNVSFTKSGGAADPDNQEVTVRADDPALGDQGLTKGFKGTVYSSQLDIFHGPYFGVRLQF